MKYFRFQFIFYAKTIIPLKKVATSSFPATPLKIEILSSPTPLLKISYEAQPPSQKGGAHYVRFDPLKRNTEQPLQGIELRETKDKDEKQTRKLIRWNRKIKNIYQF